VAAASNCLTNFMERLRLRARVGRRGLGGRDERD
jgi:hypothetical protein